MPATSKRTALVSGPDPLLRTRAREQLEAEGFDVVEAQDHEEGWRIFQDGGIDLVVVAEGVVQ